MKVPKITKAEAEKLLIQHTPGPWRVESSEFEGEYCITGSNEHGGSVLPILGRTHNWPRNALANARLIAAAPDLLEIVKGAESVIRQGGHLNEQWLLEAQAALTKTQKES